MAHDISWLAFIKKHLREKCKHRSMNMLQQTAAAKFREKVLYSCLLVTHLNDKSGRTLAMRSYVWCAY